MTAVVPSYADDPSIAPGTVVRITGKVDTCYRGGLHADRLTSRVLIVASDVNVVRLSPPNFSLEIGVTSSYNYENWTKILLQRCFEGDVPDSLRLGILLSLVQELTPMELKPTRSRLKIYCRGNEITERFFFKCAGLVSSRIVCLDSIASAFSDDGRTGNNVGENLVFTPFLDLLRPFERRRLIDLCRKQRTLIGGSTSRSSSLRGKNVGQPNKWAGDCTVWAHQTTPLDSSLASLLIESFDLAFLPQSLDVVEFEKPEKDTLGIDELRKWLQCPPTATELREREAQILREWYHIIRDTNESADFGPSYLTTLILLADAHARLSRREFVSMEDCTISIALCEESRLALLRSTGGNDNIWETPFLREPLSLAFAEADLEQVGETIAKICSNCSRSRRFSGIEREE